MPHLTLQADQLIGGRYRIEGVLGMGGMAAVYRARHVHTHKPCALKVLLQRYAKHKRVVELFENEARLGASIGAHPNIVDVFDAGHDSEANCSFLAMELLIGETLEDLLRHGPVSPGDTERLVLQLGDALDQAHRARVVHRDLKPTNLFVLRDRQGELQLKVMDFGIAKATDAGSGQATNLGTPGFAAPEQLGEIMRDVALRHGIQVARDVSPATDVWGMGLIAYEMLTALPAWQYWDVQSTGELPVVVLTASPPATERAGERADLLPPGFDAWFARATAKDAAARWQSTGEAARALAALLQAPRPRSLVLPPSAMLEPDPAAASRERVMAATIAAAPAEDLGTTWTVAMSSSEDEVERIHHALTRRPFDGERLQALFDAVGEGDRRACVAQALVEIGAATPAQRELVDATLSARHIQPRRALSAATLHLLRHGDEDELTGQILGAVAPALLASHAGATAERVSRPPPSQPLDDVPDVGKSFSWAAAILGWRRPQLFAYPTEARPWRLLPSFPADVRLGAPALVSRQPRELAFLAGHCLASAERSRLLRGLLGDTREVHDVFAAAVSLVEPRVGLKTELGKRIRPIVRALGRNLGEADRATLKEAYGRFVAAGGRSHIGMWAQGVDHSAARTGLLLCHDLGCARRMLALQGGARQRELTADLVVFLTSRAYGQLRTALGV